MSDRTFFYSIIDSIRNVRILNDKQQELVKNLSKEECYELLQEYNKIIEYVIDYILLDEEFSVGLLRIRRSQSCITFGDVEKPQGIE